MLPDAINVSRPKRPSRRLPESWLCTSMGLNLCEHPNDPPPSVRIHRQKIDDCRLSPARSVRGSAAGPRRSRFGRLAVAQDETERAAGLRSEKTEE
jgi:hypothetical protein